MSKGSLMAKTTHRARTMLSNSFTFVVVAPSELYDWLEGKSMEGKSFDWIFSTLWLVYILIAISILPILTFVVVYWLLGTL